MKTDVEEKVICDLKELAAKYNLSLGDLKQIISSNEEKDSFHIRFSESELRIVDEKRKALGLTRSGCCAMCFKKAVDEKLYKDIDVLRVIKRGFGDEKRDKRVHISLKKLGVNPQTVSDFASELGVKNSEIMRYFALTVSL